MDKYSKNDLLLQIKKERKIKYTACVISLIVIGVILWKTENYSNLFIIFGNILVPIVFLTIFVIGIISDNKAIRYYENNKII
ncbi:hypothetical protein CDJ58_03800 [Campylobacter lari]|nr:hypothetical protein [Campylobacter lari]EAK5748523.1 hypothetical protein [Campylobacter lari]